MTVIVVAHSRFIVNWTRSFSYEINIESNVPAGIYYYNNYVGTAWLAADVYICKYLYNIITLNVFSYTSRTVHRPCSLSMPDECRNLMCSIGSARVLSPTPASFMKRWRRWLVARSKIPSRGVWMMMRVFSYSWISVVIVAIHVVRKGNLKQAPTGSQIWVTNLHTYIMTLKFDLRWIIRTDSRAMLWSHYMIKYKSLRSVICTIYSRYVPSWLSNNVVLFLSRFYTFTPTFCWNLIPRSHCCATESRV